MSSKGFLSSQRNAHRNANAGTTLKRRSGNRGGRIDTGDFRGYSVQEKEICYSPPQKRARSQAQTPTQFRSANPGTNRMYDGNSVSRVCDSYVKGDIFGSNSNNGFPFAVRNNDSVHMTNTNYQKPSLAHPDYHQRSPLPLPYRKIDDEISLSFDSLPEWIPYKSASGTLNGSILNSQYNNPPINFLPKRNGDINGGFRNHGYASMASFNGNVDSQAPAFTNCPVSLPLNNANISSFVPQVIPQLNQPMLSKDLAYLLSVLQTDKKKQETVTSNNDEAPLGLDFDPALLKVRNESVINALYSDMPRQCSACGHRFKCQEDHRNHMDWHVRKNRMEKDATKMTSTRGRQKSMKSREWFTSSSLWLSASTSEGMLDVKAQFNADGENEEEEEKKEHVVPVDDDQKTCALCEEPFEDFFSHEADEWMYKDAVYLNMNEQGTNTTTTASSGLLGPIVHVKCMPESRKAPAQDLKELKIIPVTVPSVGRAVAC